MHLVIACPKCRAARVVEQGRRTAACPRCDRTLQLADLRAHFIGPNVEEAREAAGRLNARLAGREDEYVASRLVAPTSAPARHEDPFDAAAAAARRAVGEVARADAVARSLGEFSENDLMVAFERADLREPQRHLKRMLVAHVVFEPRAGLYRALGGSL